MRLRHIALYFAAVITSAAGSAACDSAANTNANANVNVNANSNTAVLTNTNNIATPRDDSNVTREEYDRNRAEYERDRGDSTIGQGANDSWIWFKTKTALATADDLRDSTINVDVENDVITLRGTVGTAAQRAQAEKVAQGIEGQRGVRNNLKVDPSDSMTNQMTGGNSNTNTNANRR